MENSKYAISSSPTNGPWLETPYSVYNGNLWNVYARGYNLDLDSYGSTGYDARPAIEVAKTDIEY